jgi:hypothetical protein
LRGGCAPSHWRTPHFHRPTIFIIPARAHPYIEKRGLRPLLNTPLGGIRGGRGKDKDSHVATLLRMTGEGAQDERVVVRENGIRYFVVRRRGCAAG